MKSKLFYSFLIVLAGFFAFVLVLQIINLNKVIDGVYLGQDIQVGRLTKNELLQLLKEVAQKDIKVDIYYDDTLIKTTTQNIGFILDYEKTAKKLYLYGRDRNLIYGLLNQIEAFLKGKHIRAEFIFDEQVFENFYSKLKKINAKNATFKVENGDIKIIPGKSGYALDKEDLKNKLFTNLSYLPDKVSVFGKIKFIQPEVTTSDIERVKGYLAQIIFSAPYFLEGNSKKFKIDQDQIYDWILLKKENNILNVYLDKEKIKVFLAQIAPLINKDPQDAIIEFKDGKLQEYISSKDGEELDINKSADYISNVVLNNFQKNISLIVKSKKAKIRKETLKDLGIEVKLAEGVSDFYGSPKSRVHNIKIGSEKLSRKILAPGEEFSVVKTLGHIGPEDGYEPSYVIKNGKTIKEYGGGLCQVSTTLFRAAMRAGLKITERFPHSYPVKYYNPQGFDAAIYGPHPDLRFVNNTKSNILIQYRIEGTKLIFEIYGKDDGRKVEIIGPIEYDKKEDGSMKAKLTRKIYDSEGRLIEDRTFWSSYRSPKDYPILRNPLE